MNLSLLLTAVTDKVGALYTDTPAPTIQRRYVPTSALTDLAGMTIDISPGKATYELETRTEAQREQLVAISFRQKLPENINPESTAGNNWIDQRLSLITPVVEGFAANAFATEAKVLGVMVAGVEHALFDAKALQEQRLFSSMILLTFLSY